MEEEDLSNLSKRERKELRKQQQREAAEAERKERKKKKLIKKVRNIAVIVLVIVLYITVRNYRLKDAPIIEIKPPFYSFGTVSVAEGAVSSLLTITNNGAKALVLKDMDTSCGCTSAAVVYQGVEGPKFGMSMHGTNPRNWRQIIPPGETAELKVYYDPTVHRDMRGSVTRSIFIFSNDPRNSKKEVRITATQVD
jgi:hypothetical protein